MAVQQAPGVDVFDSYFRRADLDRDGRISGAEAVGFFQGSGLPKPVLAQVFIYAWDCPHLVMRGEIQSPLEDFNSTRLPRHAIWMHADQNRTGYLGRQEFYNALRLVTVAQSGRELTAEIIKAALYGPAAAKIPAPRINPVSSPVTQLNSAAIPAPQTNTGMTPTGQIGAMGPTASPNPGFRDQQMIPNAGSNRLVRPPQSTATASFPMQGISQGLPGAGSIAGSRPRGSNTALFPMQGVNQGLPGVGSVAGPHPAGSNAPNLSTDWHRSPVPSGGLTSQISSPSTNLHGFGPGQLGTAPGVVRNPSTLSLPVSSIPPKQPPLQPAANNSKALVLSGNGFSSDSGFEGDMFSSTPRPKEDASTFSGISMPNTSSIVPVSVAPPNSTKPSQPNLLQSTSTIPSSGKQLQSAQPSVRQNLLDTMQTTSVLTVPNLAVRPTNSSSPSELQWPRFTQSVIQKYTAVFVEVDKDRDGKITGQEARNLFLSWRLPREVLKQVWDLSDQDNDSMLSLREFCTALYLMERFREGRPMPAMLPNSIRSDEILLSATDKPSAGYAAQAWQPRPGLPQQGIHQPQYVVPAAGGAEPSMPAPISSEADGIVQPAQPKSKVPVLEKHLVYQLSKEEQSALNTKFQEAEDAEKKVQELEKEILDSREKIEFYRTKMQELVLYKSKCDNRLNEIMERTSADKREVETLARKYEAKYKQSGDVASRLTLEQATFRDIQEKKLELFNAIVKMKQGGDTDGSLQASAEKIQSDLDELVKTLNERCKEYGLRAKPTSLVELPFGWQPGVQEGATDWDEDWDRFEEEGFTVIKELTVEVEAVAATAKLKDPSVQTDKTSNNEASSSGVDSKTENSSTITLSKPQKSSAVAPSSNDDSNAEKPSSLGEQNRSEPVDAHSEDGSARIPTGSPGKHTLEGSAQGFHSPQFGMHDISPRAKGSQSDHGGESTISAEKSVDEPSWGETFDPSDDVDSVWGFSTLNGRDTDQDRSDQNYFFGSGDFGLNPIRTGSPGAASVIDRKGPFFDSVPSTPLFNSSPMFNDGPEDHSFDSFSRFDSFRTQDSEPFPQRDTFSRFDSMRSERLTRFDSIRSTTDNSRGFPSFDDADPFGSSGPFKSSESHTPRQGTDNWSAF